ncbi:hypothetical protein SAMN05192574_11291 [Mucilaginibacter gossypiicola]|uniref:Uncharacterized protein n=1 Tax=Mucilaginibacter gossypiicola TaxID=551995 RepID=A0A1H8SBY8_9SPHI|nr:hypothetical protein [Mucilaginibacter gossypiicola]SEO76172.1 hypothetical protein SAMN05192574_11291 [Mucilaginibacter gossypiicola]
MVQNHGSNIGIACGPRYPLILHKALITGRYPLLSLMLAYDY